MVMHLAGHAPLEGQEPLSGAGDHRDAHRSPHGQPTIAVAKALGKYMRINLAKLDIDYVSEITSLKKKSKTIEALVNNKPVSGAAIVQDLLNLAKLIEQGEEDVWGIAISPNLV